MASGIRAGLWNPYTGTFSTAPHTINAFGTMKTGAGQTPAVDQAANPTEAIPGELVYKEPKPLPVLADYKQKQSSTAG